MWDELCDRISQLLLSSYTSILCAQGTDAPGGTVVRYQSHELALACVLPQWSDVAFFIEERSQVLLLIELSEGRWLQYQGLAQVITNPNETTHMLGDLPVGPADRQIVVHITPRRIDFLGDSSSWATRETLELA